LIFTTSLLTEPTRHRHDLRNGFSGVRRGLKKIYVLKTLSSHLAVGGIEGGRKAVVSVDNTVLIEQFEELVWTQRMVQSEFLGALTDNLSLTCAKIYNDSRESLPGFLCSWRGAAPTFMAGPQATGQGLCMGVAYAILVGELFDRLCLDGFTLGINPFVH
jgi:hypothetical protein